MKEKLEVIKFNNGKLEIDVHIMPDTDNVWMNSEQIAELFDIDRTGVTRHIIIFSGLKNLIKRACVQNLHIWGN